MEFTPTGRMGEEYPGRPYLNHSVPRDSYRHAYRELCECGFRFGDHQGTGVFFCPGPELRRLILNRNMSTTNLGSDDPLEYTDG